MATVQKAIAKSSSYTTRTLTTTISAPGIRQDAEISVSPNIDASKVSYVIDEVAETIKVTLTNVSYTRYTSYQGSGHYQCTYSFSVSPYSHTTTSSSPCNRALVIDGAHGILKDETYIPGSTYYTHYFEYTITVDYRTFPEFATKEGGQLKTASDGWVRVNGQLKQIQQIWVRANGQLKEV